MITNRRPATVTILAVIVLIIPVMNIIRFWAAIRFWEMLTKIEVRPGPIYIAFTGLFWVIAGIWLFWALWMPHPKVKVAAMILILLYLMYYWTDRLIFQNYIQRENTPFTVAMSILVVFYTVFTLSLPSNQIYFLRKYEQ
jgi:O-antigen ligase